MPRFGASFLTPLLLLAACDGGSINPAADASNIADADAAGASADAAPADAARPDAAAIDTGLSDSGPDAGPSCGPTGTFHQQVLSDPGGGEPRYYLLHVPASVRCDTPSPLLVDFHGTAGDVPEEAYQTPALIDTADREGFIVVRPRSRFSQEGGGNIYRWDQNPGDLARNVAFTRLLITTLMNVYAIDPARIYVSGFSSGTNMAAQLLAPANAAPHHFAGFGFVGGGFWDDPGAIALAPGTEAPRIWAVSGYKDYLHSALSSLLSKLDQAGAPLDHRFIREDNAGHDLFGWHFREMWAWLARGERPAPGTLSSTLGWSRDRSFPDDTSLTDLSVAPSGDLLATSAGGRIYRRDAGSQRWSRTSTLAGAPPLTGVCMLGSGVGLAVGAQFVARSEDGGRSWAAAQAIPEFFGAYFGSSYLNSISCAGRGLFIGGGYWTGVISEDSGLDWSGAAMSLIPQVPAQVAALRVVRVGNATTALAAGYGTFIGRSDDGQQFTTVSAPVAADWLNGVAWAPGGHWWVVGDGGTIVHSADDGQTFADQSLPIEGGDLYGVDFWDAQIGLTVGAHGVALLTEDGGAHWRHVDTGLDAYLAAVRFLDAHQAIAVGEGGLVLTLMR